jgi:hypothetical protein
MNIRFKRCFRFPLLNQLYIESTHCLNLQGTSSLKMEAVCYSETLVPTYKPTRHYYPEDQHRRENLKLQTLNSSYSFYFTAQIHKNSLGSFGDEAYGPKDTKLGLFLISAIHLVRETLRIRILILYDISNQDTAEIRW